MKKSIVILASCLLFVFTASSCGNSDKIAKLKEAASNTTQSKATTVATTKEDTGETTKANSAATTKTAETTAKDTNTTETVALHRKTNLPAKGPAVKGTDCILTPLGITESKGSEYFKPNTGNVYVCPILRIENTGTEEIISSTMLSYKAEVDGKDTSLSILGMANWEGPTDLDQLDTDIPAGGDLDGYIGFEVPAGWQKLTLSFKSNLLGSDNDVTVVEFTRAMLIATP